MPSAMYGHDHGVREFEAAAALLARSARKWPTCWCSHRFGLDDAPEAFRVAG